MNFQAFITETDSFGHLGGNGFEPRKPHKYVQGNIRMLFKLNRFRERSSEPPCLSKERREY